jgi:hypothetical protein
MLLLTAVTVGLLAAGAPPVDFGPTPIVPLTPPPRVVVLEADRDATLFEETNGLLASGAGDGLFVGKTLQGFGALRRSLLHFSPPDIAGSGRGAVLEGAVLVLHASPTLPSQPDPGPLKLHEVLADWSEGPSVSPLGLGVPAEEGDATWIHASYPGEFWLQNGGQFDGGPVASATREGDWIADPDANYGLLVIGNEAVPQTAKTIASREHADASVHPTLELTVRSGLSGLAIPTRRIGRATDLRAR